MSTVLHVDQQIPPDEGTLVSTAPLPLPYPPTLMRQFTPPPEGLRPPSPPSPEADGSVFSPNASPAGRRSATDAAGAGGGAAPAAAADAEAAPAKAPGTSSRPVSRGLEGRESGAGQLMLPDGGSRQQADQS